MNEKLKRIVADTLGLDAAEIGNDASMKTVESWDSVAHLNIVMSVEGAFSVSFSPEQVLELTSLRALEAALEEAGAAG